jgi:hypothetical protein
MTYSRDRNEEERGRRRNNENGDDYPTFREDCERGVTKPDNMKAVREIRDKSDDLDGQSPWSSW